MVASWEINGDRGTCEFGGYGVDVKLSHSQNTPKVFWSAKGNSFVIVKTDRGCWDFRGETVGLYSINGIGEIRWVIYRDWEDNEGAAEYFGLEALDR